MVMAFILFASICINLLFRIFRRRTKRGRIYIGIGLEIITFSNETDQFVKIKNYNSLMQLSFQLLYCIMEQ